MLSPPTRDGIEAFVRRVDGQRFKEHEIVQRKELPSRPTTTYGYLESEENAEFEIGVVFHDSAKLRHCDNDWRLVFSVDGRRIANVACSRRSTDCTVSSMEFAECGEVMRGNLRFTTLRITDNDEEVTLAGQDLMVIGDIQIDLYRGVRRERSCGCSTPHKGKARDLKSLPKVDLGVAHERDKKWSGAVGVGYTTPASPSSSGGRSSIQWTDFDTDKPYHRFLFKYRTTPILQLLRVIGTHTPSKLSSKSKQKVIYISDSESEGEDQVLISPTKRRRDTEEEDIKPRIQTPGLYVKPRWGSDQDVRPDIGIGRDVKPRLGLGRDVKPNLTRRGVTPDVKPMLTAMGQLSLGGRKRGKTPVLFKFNP